MTAGTLHPFDHPALLYRGSDEYLAGTVPFITGALAAGEPVAVAAPATNLRLVRDALGADAQRVELHDMSVVGRNPGRILPRLLLAFAEEHAGARVRVVGEPVWAARSNDEYLACVQHEALINLAFAGRAAAILCPYDAVALSAAWLHEAERTHPTIATPTRRWDSPHYADPIDVATQANRPLPEPPPQAARITVDMDNLSTIRRFVIEQATAAGGAPDRVVDLTIAVNELAANTIEHSGGRGELAVWTDGGRIVCQLHDGGHIADPLAGRRPVPPDALGGGRGLLLVHQLCDLVRVHSTPAGTTVRVDIEICAALDAAAVAG